MPNFEVVAWGHNGNASFTFRPRPTPRLGAMIGGGMQKEIDVGIVHRHLIMFVFEGKGGAARGQRMISQGLDRYRTLGGVADKDTTHQPTERWRVVIERRARMEKEHTVALADIVDKGHAGLLRRPRRGLGPRPVVGFGEDHQPIGGHPFGGPLGRIFEIIKFIAAFTQAGQPITGKGSRMGAVIT